MFGFILQHRGIPYCNIPCYSLLFGPGGYGRGGTESYQYFADEKLTPAELDAVRYVLFPSYHCGTVKPVLSGQPRGML